MSTISCPTHIQSIFDPVSCVRHIFSYCRQWCAMLHNSKICSFLLIDDIPHITQKKRPMVFSPVILGSMLGNRILQSTCSESVRLKTEGQCFQNVGALSPPSAMHHKEVLAPSSVLTCSGRNGVSRLLRERKKVQ